jgi:hypothetical protein
VRVLGQLNSRHNPQKFADMLADGAHIESTNTYAKKQ